MSSAERLAAERNVWLATVRPTGRPHLAPVWFVFLGGRFWVCTGATSVKVRNVTGSPVVSVSLEDGDRPMVAEGRATLVDRPFPDEVVAAFREKYGWNIVPTDELLGETALVRIDVDRWLFGDPTGG